MLSNKVKGKGYWGRGLRLQIWKQINFRSYDVEQIFKNLSKNVDVCNGDAAKGKEARLSFGTDIKLKIGHLVVGHIESLYSKDSENL